MKHIELLNEDVSYLETFTMLPCCNTTNGGGGGCGCDTYVCGAANVPVCGCDTDGCTSCNVYVDVCGVCNY